MRRQHWIAGVVAVVAVIVGVMSVGVAVGARGPMGGPHMGGMTGMHVSSEFDYLAHMIPHHQEAIDTAAIVAARTDRPQLAAFAANIVETQTAEIAQMRSWLGAWYGNPNPSVDYQPMMRDLSGLNGDALDRTFLEDMIPHHMMAVMMSRQLLNRGLVVHTPVRPFAQNIITVQSAEIRQMRAWLRTWFGVRGHGMGMGMGMGMR